jgi:adenylate kinase
MSAMSRAIRACGGAASRRSLSVAASKEAPAAAAAAVVVAGRRAGRDRGEDGSRVQWVFLGCPGVGKGTYAGRLSRLLGVPHIATGDLVRDALASQDPLSKQVLLLASASISVWISSRRCFANLLITVGQLRDMI